MYVRMIRNDIKKSPLSSLTILIFTALSSALLALSLALIVSVTGAVGRLMEDAATPHFMQMHSGLPDIKELSAFAAQRSEVEQFQVLPFLNIEGAQISLGRNTLAGSVQDNGLCTQSGSFDFLLDLNGQAIHPKDGELYVPVSYLLNQTVELGDPALICGRPFTVAGFLRDSQMNSPLASSKRFLVSSGDFSHLKDQGSLESLIEFRLKDPADLKNFESAYASSGLSSNGPVLTYPLFRMINSLSDALLSAVLILLSVLVTAISLLCIRFTLLARLEDDYREIGTMKAIGLRASEIKKLYLAKYTLILSFGCLLGFLLSSVLQRPMLRILHTTMGTGNSRTSPAIAAMIGALAVLLPSIAAVSRMLNRLRGISAAAAVRTGLFDGRTAGADWLRLSRNQLLPVNVFLGLKDLLARVKLYTAMLAILILVLFLTCVPQYLYRTVTSDSFITYLGVGRCDLRMDIQQTDRIAEKAEAAAAAMEQDAGIETYSVLTTKNYTLVSEDGSGSLLQIEFGDHLTFPVEYAEGRAPVAEDEIALSVLNARDLKKRPGDLLTLETPAGNRQIRVCGTYSDFTNGGKTAKAVFDDASTEVMRSVVCASLTSPSLVRSKVSEYAKRFPFAKVTDIKNYIGHTFGTVIRASKTAASAADAAALLIGGLITLLFMNLLIAKDRYSIAVMKTLGFTGRDIAVQYLTRAFLVSVTGMLLGTLLAKTLGQTLAGAAAGAFGADSFHFESLPAAVSLSRALALLFVLLLAAWAGTKGIKTTKLSDHIKE